MLSTACPRMPGLNVIRLLERSRVVIEQDEDEKFIQNLFGNLKRSLGRVNSIEIDLTGVGYEGVDWK